MRLSTKKRNNNAFLYLPYFRIYVKIKSAKAVTQIRVTAFANLLNKSTPCSLKKAMVHLIGFLVKE